MNTPLPKPTDPVTNKPNNQGAQAAVPPDKDTKVTPAPNEIGRSVAPAGGPKMEGVNPNLAPKETAPEPPKPELNPPAPGIKPPVAPVPKIGKSPVPAETSQRLLQNQVDQRLHQSLGMKIVSQKLLRPKAILKN